MRGGKPCPFSHVEAGTVVCIRKLSASPEVSVRLRELGFCEQQQIKLLTRDSSFICQVCNARLALAQNSADSILVETLSDTQPICS